MTLLASLYPNYDSLGYDFEAAYECPKRLVITFDDAKAWAESELDEGREPQKWEYEEYDSSVRRFGQWNCKCNEYGEAEVWILVVEDVPFWSSNFEGV